jgi:hypothetical protein
MTRNYLKALGIEDVELIDKIMSEHGRDIERLKIQLEEVKGRADALNERYQGVDLDGLKKQIEDHKKEIEDLKSQTVDQETKHEAEIEALKNISEVDTYMSNHKFVNKATKEYIKLQLIEAVKAGKTVVDGFKELTKDDKGVDLPDIFEKAKPSGVDFPGGGKPALKEVTKEQFKKMGYAEMLKLKRENKGMYESLKQEV